jgi:hypothetical protein
MSILIDVTVSIPNTVCIKSEHVLKMCLFKVLTISDLFFGTGLLAIE